MDETAAKAQPKETAKAAQAFADYVALGWDRSLRKLAAVYVEQGQYKTSASALSLLNLWSTSHGWQQRIKDLATSQIEQVAELRNGIYLRTVREYDRRTDPSMIEAFHLGDLHGVYDRVKPEVPKSALVSSDGGAITINVIERPDGPA